MLLQSNRLNNLFLMTSNSTFTSGIPQPLRILQDSEPPHLFVDFPIGGQSVATSNSVVAGRVGDMLSGFMGLNEWVHSSPIEGPSPWSAGFQPAAASPWPSMRANATAGRIPMLLVRSADF